MIGATKIFDRTPNKPWEEKCFVREEQQEGYRIGGWGIERL
uniref:Uncharacterized protein n=1 Tax=Candidatus Kentrum sp. FM TaxID=2126340 RepID=A0A450TV67_9GAMM|nr:MAG: hypothetical protein BECKFM1743A_GA0114220_101118 [Candidatus Kentron sp. FM]VFJ72778.1 MAG: hypothetical protein BECKFM1743C_GA0114222_106702 [Candidatus Kentron sp. FM]VFK09046.1 MAG: hypothetical protein BECKFM1743B_GA0114221_100937 [Candidatus Kentron sp. FM]